MRDDLAKILFLSFLREATVSSSGMRKDVHSLMLLIQQFFRRPRRLLLPLQGALKVSFGEIVVACDMPQPCEFLSLDSCQKRFLWVRIEVGLAPHPVVVSVFQVGDAVE